MSTYPYVDTILQGRLPRFKMTWPDGYEAEVNLARDLQTALTATLRYCSVLATEPEARLAAIVDFTFNLGAGRLQTSTLRRRINQRDWSSAGQELRRWV